MPPLDPHTLSTPVLRARVLLQKMEMIGNVRKRLAHFYKHVKKEEMLQKLYTTKLNETG